MAALSTKSTEQSRAYESRVAGLEEALLDKRRMEEQLSQARDDLGHQVKRLEIQLNEKDSTVQVSQLVYKPLFKTRHKMAYHSRKLVTKKKWVS